MSVPVGRQTVLPEFGPVGFPYRFTRTNGGAVHLVPEPRCDGGTGRTVCGRNVHCEPVRSQFDVLRLFVEACDRCRLGLSDDEVRVVTTMANANATRRYTEAEFR